MLANILGLVTGVTPIATISSWPLLNDLIGLNTASNDVIYTRAGSNATVVDNEGLRRLLPSNDSPPLIGARLVINEFDTVDVSTGNWLEFGTGTITGGQPDPDDGNNAYKVVPTSGNWDLYQQINMPVGTVFRFSYWVMKTNGAGVNLNVWSGKDNAELLLYPVTSEWKRVVGDVITVTASPNSVGWEFKTGDGVDDAIIYRPQYEIITGHTEQDPGEFVLPVADGGLGYEYFKTTNGNTVTANVIDESVAGTALTSMKGLMTEGAGASDILQSNNFDASWVLSGTCGKTQDGTIAGDDGALWTLDSNGAAAVDGYEQTVTVTGQTETAISFLVENGTSPISHAKLAMTGGTTPVTPQIKLTWDGAGVPTASDGATAFTKTKVTATNISGVYLVEVTYDDSGDATGNTSAKLSLHPDFSTTGLTSRFGYINFEKNKDHSTSYIPTAASVPVNRAISKAPVEFLNSGGAISDVAVSCEIDWKATRNVADIYFLSIQEGANKSMSLRFDFSAGEFAFYWDGDAGSNATITTSTFNPAIDQTLKIAIRQASVAGTDISAGIVITIGGTTTAPVTGADAEAALTGLAGADLMYIGSRDATTFHTNTSIKELRIITDPSQMTDTYLEALTAP